MKQKFVDLYINTAFEVAKLSYCNRLKVGSIIVKDNRIISIGYNGTPSGMPNVCEDASNTTLPIVIHSEINSILKLARSTESAENAVMFVTHAPCIECSKAIIQSGISKVFYAIDYRSMDGISLLNAVGIDVTKVILPA